MRRWIPVLAAGALTIAPASVAADSITPIRMLVRVAAVARRDRPLAVRVEVNADPGVLDVRVGAVRAQVKLAAGECAGQFAHSAGKMLLDKALKPQPVPGHAYAGAAAGRARPGGYGQHVMCAFPDDSYEQFASDTNQVTVDVSRPCTVAADRYDRLRARRRAPRAALLALQRGARAGCGPGVPL